jgi:dolichol-phosphate mannosyltransferase
VPDCLVIIPTYNERENVERMVDTVMGLAKPFHLLIVDDGSPDGTAALVKEKMKQHPDRIFIEERKGKLGLGTAYIHGFRWALKRDYQFVFEMDCDFSHNPEDLIKLYDAAVNTPADLVIGSRYIKGVNVVNWPMGRVLMSYYASAYVRFITGMTIPRHHGRLQMLPQTSVGDHPVGQGAVLRLCVSDRDEVPDMEIRLPYP